MVSEDAEPRGRGLKGKEPDTRALEELSVSELELRVAALEAEIGRIRALIEKKSAMRSAADAVFKSG